MDLEKKQEKLKELIASIRRATGLNQQEISFGAGYESKTLTQTLSSGKSIDATIKQLEIVYRHELNNSTNFNSMALDPTRPTTLEDVAATLEGLAQTVRGMQKSQDLDQSGGSGKTAASKIGDHLRKGRKASTGKSGRGQ